MRSRHHFPISVGVGLALAAVIDTPVPWVVTVAFAGLLGTFVDLDHFVIARVRTGSWDALTRCLADPRMALLDQDEIFDPGDVGSAARLATHVLITVALVALLAGPAPGLAVVAGVVLVVHILSDVAWDRWRSKSD
ncbi:MAG: hypothetical protein ACI91T_002854 [Natronomonas sp.]|jgi:hypothetical protein